MFDVHLSATEAPSVHRPPAGTSRLFSEQQLMDCSWEYGNNMACDGGDYQPAITYVSQNPQGGHLNIATAFRAMHFQIFCAAQ